MFMKTIPFSTLVIAVVFLLEAAGTREKYDKTLYAVMAILLLVITIVATKVLIL